MINNIKCTLDTLNIKCTLDTLNIKCTLDTLNIKCTFNQTQFMNNKIVKVRGRQGTKSLDLTIPVSLNSKFDINPGDLYEVKVEKNEDKFQIVYTLIYKNKKAI